MIYNKDSIGVMLRLNDEDCAFAILRYFYHYGFVTDANYKMNLNKYCKNKIADLKSFEAVEDKKYVSLDMAVQLAKDYKGERPLANYLMSLVDKRTITRSNYYETLVILGYEFVGRCSIIKVDEHYMNALSYLTKTGMDQADTKERFAPCLLNCTIANVINDYQNGHLKPEEFKILAKMMGHPLIPDTLRKNKSSKEEKDLFVNSLSHGFLCPLFEEGIDYIYNVDEIKEAQEGLESMFKGLQKESKVTPLDALGILCFDFIDGNINSRELLLDQIALGQKFYLNLGFMPATVLRYELKRVLGQKD